MRWNPKVDIRVLSALLMMYGALSYYAYGFHIGSPPGHSIGRAILFWRAFGTCFLWVGPFLALGLIVIHARESNKQPYWVSIAVGIAVSPWIIVVPWYVSIF